MATTKRKRRLTKLKVDEVSFVDCPANFTPFLFTKNDIEKAFKGLDLKFSTDGTSDNTTVHINGKQISNVRGLFLSYAPIGEDISLHVEYTIASAGTSAGGFKSVKTFRLTKNEKDEGTVAEEVVSIDADPEDIEVLKSYLGEDIGEVDGTIASELVTQLNIVELYKSDLPPDLVEAINSVALLATEMEVLPAAEETKMKKDETAETSTETKETGEATKEETTAQTVDIAAIAAAVTTSVMEQVNAKFDEMKPAVSKDEKDEKDSTASQEEEEVSAEELGEEIAQTVVAALSDETDK